MQRISVTPELSRFPEAFHSLLDYPVYSSSCSREASVWFLDREDGFYLKTAKKGSLQKEAAMTAYFHSKGLAAEVLSYTSDEQDWMLTRRIPGEDCTHEMYLSDPKRLCDTTAETLRMLHETAFDGCPVTDRNQTYLDTAREGFSSGRFDPSLFPVRWQFPSQEEAWQEAERNARFLKPDVLLHGDYCLPNVMLDSWRFSGFLDLDCAGVGDRHIDLFWGSWTLYFNLKTDAYFDRFLDAYGRDSIHPELLRTVAALEVFR